MDINFDLTKSCYLTTKYYFTNIIVIKHVFARKLSSYFTYLYFIINIISKLLPTIKYFH